MQDCIKGTITEEKTWPPESFKRTSLRPCRPATLNHATDKQQQNNKSKSKSGGALWDTFGPAYLDSDISPDTQPSSRNCWRCQNSRRNRTACIADWSRQRSSATPSLGKDRGPPVSDMGSCHLGKEEREELHEIILRYVIIKLMLK